MFPQYLRRPFSPQSCYAITNVLWEGFSALLLMILWVTQYTAFLQVAYITFAEFVLWYVKFVLELDGVTHLSNDTNDTLSLNVWRYSVWSRSSKL